MKQFFGAFFGSVIGVLILGVLGIFIVIGLIAGSMKGISAGDKGNFVTVKDNSVLHFKLEGSIVDRGVENPFEEFDLGPFNSPSVLGLNDITAILEKAKTDDKIKGVYLDVQNAFSGFASIEDIRNAIIDFKKSGKFVYAYAEVYTQKTYYLATAASKIYMNPQGGMEFKGLSTQLMFFKNALEKLNVEMQIFRHGKFKSAIEPFMLDKMSEDNRAQIRSYISSIWGTMLKGVSEQRNISIDDLNSLANNLTINSPESALEAKMVDGLLYEDEVISLIKKDLKIAEKDKLNLVQLNKYKGKSKSLKIGKKDKLAVIYAIGQITSGEGDDETIGSARIAKAIRDARKDSSVKAIVFRVNSPGGSALASDVIWREVSLTKNVKPFIVSMGDLAASGGYYISCAADRIFAQPNTITGSIGVFGIIPNAKKAFAEKLGINIDTVNTNKHSDLGTIFRGVTNEERNYIQSSVEQIYDTFITRVAEGRGISKNTVDSIGQGRVWSGADALKINLIDEMGGLTEAIKYAVKTAKLGENYRLVEYPKQKNPFAMFLEKNEDEMESKLIKKNLGPQYDYLKFVKNIVTQKGAQTRLPYDLIIE